MASLAVGLILEKIASKDKDFRYMATSDLLNELQKDNFKLDSDTERKVSQIVLQQLDDASGDISGLAVKCLAPLVKKVNEGRVVDIVESLCQRLLTGREQQRDTASIALKTVVAEISSGSVAQCVVVSLTPKLTKGITSSETSTEIKSECLDILCDVLHRFGGLMTADHEKLLNALLVQLNLQRAGLRKRAIQCLASLAASMSDDLLARATITVVQILKNKEVRPEMTRTNIQMIGAFCRAVGYRFGPHLNEVVPLLISYCENASENDDELRENSLQALESFVVRCPRDVAPHTNTILDLTLEYLSYDPNFTDDMDEDQDEDMDAEEEEDEESADEYSDDEDVSWKVRRAAAKCLSAVISSRPEMLAILYVEASPKLIERFKEREENVKIDVFSAFIDLLRQTGNVTKGSGDIRSSGPLYVLQLEVPKVVKSLNKQLREKSVKTKVGAFSVLKELVIVLPDSLSDHVGSLVPGIEKALNDKTSNSNLKIEALIFTRLVMASHSSAVFHPHIRALSVPVLTAVGERYYKVTAEALRVCGELVKAIRPNFDMPPVFNYIPFVHPIYNAIFQRLTAQDQDQEVKECAISCMGLVISTLGDQLKNELGTCLPLLLERLRNEITRLTAVKAFATIAESPLKIDLSSVLEQVVTELTTFLRQANRALRQASLSTLNALLKAYSNKISPSSYESIVTELSSLMSDADLHMTALALELCCTMMVDKQHHANAGMSVCERVLPQALVLVKSSLLQGQALQTLQGFFAALVQSENTSFETLLDALLDTARSAVAPGGPASKQAFYSIAQCAAVLCLAAGDAKCSSTVAMLITTLRTSNGTDATQLLSLLCLGEIGRRKDLSAHANIEGVVIGSFQSPSEEIKAAASYALGNIAVGNLAQYLPFILIQIDRQAKLQYLLLHSLKEVIARQSLNGEGKVDLRDSDVQKILSLLFTHCESEEEGVRNVVAECLGKLAFIEPEKLVPALKDRTASSSAFTRATVVIAIKYTIVERPQPIDAYIKPCIASFLLLIKDEDRHVRRAAVSALSTAAHNKPGLVKDLLPTLLPLLYDQTVVKKELIRTVDLGPFKHIVDDGLELRKGAFECMDTLLDSCLDQIDPSYFITPFLLSGLSVMDALVDPLEKSVTNKTKPDAVKQEVDRNEDMIRSALRAIDSLNRINGEPTARFKAFMNHVVKSGSLADKYSAVCHESDTVGGGDIMDLN
ncbi:hypothetical protein CY35_01G092900 [Sphagnum magellanicum]|nr:hypothetical protein CY35_01G092900 [Sphagnum magellanicum]KAH9575076.1 hypothetical protein CY35_01G092900 [Sphagnum magellanicum]